MAGGTHTLRVAGVGEAKAAGAAFSAGEVARFMTETGALVTFAQAPSIPPGVAVTPCVMATRDEVVAPRATQAMTTTDGGSATPDVEAHNAEWDAILTYLAEVIGGSQDTAQSTVAARLQNTAAAPASADAIRRSPPRTRQTSTVVQQIPQLSGLAAPRPIQAPLPASRLASFIHPMGYYQFLFDRRRDLTRDLDVTVRAYYARHEIRRCEAAGWNDRRMIEYLRHFKVHLYSYGKQVQTIPACFRYLRQNLKRFVHEVELAHEYVRRALEIFFDEIEETLDGTLKIARNSSIRRYLGNVLQTTNTTTLTQALLRLRYYLININNYLNHHKANIIFASSRTDDQPYSYDPDIPLGVTLPNDEGKMMRVKEWLSW